MSFMAVGAIGGAVIGGLFSQSAANREAKERRARERAAILAERQSARYLHSAVEDSVNLAQAVNRESALNAVAEIGRGAGAAKRDTKQGIQKAEGKLMAQSEGLTSGNSRGRQMVNLLSQGNKMMMKVNKEQVGMVSKLSDMYDNKQNELNNKLIASYQKMSAILTDEGISSVGSTQGAWVSGAISGAQTGMGAVSAYKSI